MKRSRENSRFDDGFDSDLALLRAAAIPGKILKEKVKDVVIRVFLGGRASVQVQPFMTSLELCRSTWDSTYEYFPTVEFMTTDGLKRRGWHRDVRFLIDWLLESDFHYILNHVHQGMQMYNCCDIPEQLLRLRTHKGFPSNFQLQCPIFLQDKFAYISACEDICIPTVRFEMTEVFNTLSNRKLKNFLIKHNGGNGWVVKAPYSTNGQDVVNCKDDHSAIVELRKMVDRLSTRVPYVMMQPRLRNLKEYKMICHHGVIVYKVQKKKDPGKAFPGVEDFAKHALDTLSTRLPQCMTDFMIRVDIMQLDCGRLVVNEFESFEAQYCGAGEVDTISFLEGYWANTLTTHALIYKHSK
jgi:hypothetical protein